MLEDQTIGQLHLSARERLANHHQKMMNKIIKQNSDKEKYWILGKIVSKRKNGRTGIKVVLEAFDVQPEVQKESYLYEMDNVEGSRKLIWVMHPNNQLNIPSINKSISVAG